MKKLLTISLVFIALWASFTLGTHQTKPIHGNLVVDTFDNPYSITILDDHEVQLISKCDTVSLYLENSGALADEYVIFVKK